jgi:hypothetical protein
MCRIWGRCHIDHPEYIVVDVWVPMEDDARRSTEDNTECFAIVRSAIMAIHTLERRPIER